MPVKIQTETQHHKTCALADHVSDDDGRREHKLPVSGVAHRSSTNHQKPQTYGERTMAQVQVRVLLHGPVPLGEKTANSTHFVKAGRTPDMDNTLLYTESMYVLVCTCMYVCVYVCVHVCMCVLYIHT